MKGGHRRQRVAYNWRNNRQEFVLGDTGRLKMLVYRACFEIIFPSKQKTLSFCCLQSCCVSSSQQCDVAVMPVATWCTCQELFRPTRQTAKRKSSTSYGISVSVLSLRGQRLFVLLSSPAVIIILVFTGKSVIFMLTSKVFWTALHHVLHCFCTCVCQSVHLNKTLT